MRQQGTGEETGAGRELIGGEDTGSRAGLNEENSGQVWWEVVEGKNTKSMAGLTRKIQHRCAGEVKSKSF